MTVQWIATLLARQWFLIGLLAAIVTGWNAPAHIGNASWANAVTQLAIMAVFFCSGLTLRSGELLRSTIDWPLHLHTQALSLGWGPLCGIALAWLLYPLHHNPALTIGMVLCAALPTTIAFCVAITRAVGGATSLALINATLGNVVGIFLTPLWIMLATGSVVSLPFWETVGRLLPLVVLPLILGQLCRCIIHPWLASLERPLKILPLLFITCIVFFSLARGSNGSDAMTLGALIICVIFSVMLHGTLLVSAWWTTAQRHPPMRAAIVICASQKTLALGAPLVWLCFHDHPDIALILLPIIVYHPLQLIVAAAATPALARWVRNQESPSMQSANND